MNRLILDRCRKPTAKFIRPLSLYYDFMRLISNFSKSSWNVIVLRRLTKLNSPNARSNDNFEISTYNINVIIEFDYFTQIYAFT